MLQSAQNVHRPPVRSRVAAGVLLTLAALAMVPPTAQAQSTVGNPVDLQFVVVNATTGQPGTVERLALDLAGGRQNRILDFEPSGPEFVAEQVPVLERGEYVLTVWYEGVPYWWAKQGRDLIAGPTTLHVFDLTDSLEPVRIVGLNLVVRRQETVVQLEYMLQLQNTAEPQATVSVQPATLKLKLPTGAAGFQAEYRRGPEPTPIPVTSAGGGRVGLDVPLTPGANRVRLTAAVPWQDGLVLPVEANVPLDAWSLLVSPEWIEVMAFDLDSDADQSVVGFGRYVGPALEADREMSIRLTAGTGPAAETDSLFTQPATEETAATDAAADEEGQSMVPPFAFAAVLIIILVVAVFRRRGA